MNKKNRVSAACLLCVFWACLLFPAFAQEDAKALTLRVAYYPLDGFFEYDENGHECGYGVDYLNELKKYANIEWEFVPVDTWEKIGDMMRRGEVDVSLPVSEPLTVSKSFSYTMEPIITTYHAIMTLKNRDDLYYRDYDAISGLKIGIVEALLLKTGVSDYMASIGILDHLTYYKDYNECYAALRAGEVDALISNIMDETDDLKVLDKFCVTKNYVTTLKNSPNYAIINNAMTQLAIVNPSFQANLYEQYYLDRATEPFTKAETEYLQSLSSLTVAVYADRKPVSYYDAESGKYKGIAIEIADVLSEYLGVPFQYVPITTKDRYDMLDSADLVMPVARVADAEKYFGTESILDSEIVLAVRNGGEEPITGSRVGVLTSAAGIRSAIEQEGKFQIVEYATGDEALQALQRGEISAYANISYVLNWLMDNPRYNDLHVLHYQRLPLAYEICGRAEDTLLQSALAKVIRKLSAEETEQIVRENTSFSVTDLTIADRLYIYRAELIALCAAAVVMAIGVLMYHCTRSRYITAITQKSAEQEKANRAKSDFLSRMSHDMRTPMNGILGLAALMRDETDMTAIKRDLAQLEMSGQYLLGLINDTLDMSKIESGKLELHLAPIDSEAVFTNVLGNAARMAQDKGVKLEIHTPEIKHGQWVRVMADASRLEQVVMNVLSNAIKFTPAGGTVDLTMETLSVTPDQVVDRYIIRDSGIGISEAFLPHIFEPFSQEGRAETDHKSGTGLGMPIVKQLLELMGGEVSIKSKQGEGTEVTLLVRYPVCHDAVTDAPARQADESILKGKKVLVCEDHPLNTQIAERLLAKKGVKVDCAENGRLGVERFCASAAGEYAAILMDVRMPVMNGLEAARAIRLLERKDAKTIPIIAMTANAYVEDVEQCLQAGMNAHLSKPIEPEKLYETLAEYCK